MRQKVPAEKFLADLTSQLRLVRHVRIVVKDAAGERLPLRPPAGAAETSRDEQAPVWFAALIAPRVASRDRKSTRLNSSHLGISYAVFCLKKKIQQARGQKSIFE